MRRRAVAGGVFVALGAVLAVASTSLAADAPRTTEVSAFTSTARAYAVRVLFDTPGALPVGPLLELTAPEARAGLSTDDVGDAFSAVGYPGPVVAGLPQILAATGNKPPDLPPYPLAVEASSSGPTEVDDTTSAPGSAMHAEAHDGRSAADTRTPALGLPGVLSVGSLRATSEVVHDGGIAVRSTTVATDVDLLGGLLHLAGVRSTATTASPPGAGRAPTGTAETVVTGATFLGTPAVVTPDGVELAPDRTIRHDLVAQALDRLGGPNGLLAATGLRIRAGATTERIAGDTANVGAEGLTLELDGTLDTSALDAVLAALPPLPTLQGAPMQPADLVAALRARQVRTLNVAQATADLTSRVGGPAADDFGGGTSGALPDVGGTSPAFGAGGATAPGAPAVAVPAQPASSSGEPPRLPALPASGALVAIGGALLASVGARRFAELALAPAPTAECDLTTPEAEAP